MTVRALIILPKSTREDLELANGLNSRKGYTLDF